MCVLPYKYRKILAMLLKLMKLCDITGSRALSRTTLTRHTRVLGPDHPDTLEATFALGFALAKQMKDAAALPVLKGVLARQEVVLGHSHPDTQRTTSYLRMLLQ